MDALLCPAFWSHFNQQNSLRDSAFSHRPYYDSVEQNTESDIVVLEISGAKGNYALLFNIMKSLRVILKKLWLVITAEFFSALLSLVECCVTCMKMKGN